MKYILIVLVLIFIGCGARRPTNKPTSPPPNIASNPGPQKPVSIYVDNSETNEAVSRAIKSCGLRDEVDDIGIWLGNITAIEIRREQMKLDEVRKWAQSITDSVLYPIYQNQLDYIQRHIDDANLELTDHVIARRQAKYNSDIAKSRSIYVPMPPCAPPIPDIRDLHK